MQFPLKKVKDVLYAHGFDNTIPITFREYNEAFEGVNININQFVLDANAKRTKNASVQFIVRYNNNDYQKAEDTANKILEIFEYDTIGNYAIDVFTINYAYLMSESINLPTLNYEIFSINAVLNYSY